MGFVNEQLEVALNPKNVPCAANSVEAGRLPSIRFLEVKLSRKGYMKKIVDLQRAIETMNWPGQNNRSSVAGGSRGLFLGAQTNRGLLLSPEDWVNLESFGFPVRQYPEMDSNQTSQTSANHLVGDEGTLQGQSSSALDVGRGSSTADLPAKVVKTYDFVQSDFSTIVKALEREDSANRKDTQLKAHSSGPNTSQYTQVWVSRRPQLP